MTKRILPLAVCLLAVAGLAWSVATWPADPFRAAYDTAQPGTLISEVERSLGRPPDFIHTDSHQWQRGEDIATYAVRDGARRGR